MEMSWWINSCLNWHPCVEKNTEVHYLDTILPWNIDWDWIESLGIMGRIDILTLWDMEYIPTSLFLNFFIIFIALLVWVLHIVHELIPAFHCSANVNEIYFKFDLFLLYREITVFINFIFCIIDHCFLKFFLSTILIFYLEKCYLWTWINFSSYKFYFYYLLFVSLKWLTETSRMIW